MKMAINDFLIFCYRQQTFIDILEKLHIVKEIGFVNVCHPITNNNEAVVLKLQHPALLSRLICYILNKCMDEDGEKRAERLSQLGYINKVRI